MKKSTGKMFIRGFMKSFLLSFFIIAILFGVGVLSYKTVMKELNIKVPKKETAVVAYKPQQKEQITEASVEVVSKNLIYSYDKKSGEIENLILEIYRSDAKKMTYITIPVRTQFTMSDTLYRKLIGVYPEIPQIIKLSNLSKYFNKTTEFDYGSLIIEDLLQIKLSYYTAIPSDLFKTIFTEELTKAKKVQQTAAKDASQAAITVQKLPKEVFNKDYIKRLETLNSKDKIKSYIEDIYSSVKSNLTLYDKMNYLESYSSTSIKDVTFDLIQGEDQNNAYLVDPIAAANQLEQYMTGNGLN